MYNFKFNNHQYEADNIGLNGGELTIYADGMVVAGLRAGGTFSMMTEDDVEFTVDLPEGQLGFNFNGFGGSNNITFDLTNRKASVLFVDLTDDERELLAA